jgi:hypothetical protein
MNGSSGRAGGRAGAAQAGAALLVSLASILAVSVLAVTFLRRTSSFEGRIGGEVDRVQAFNVAEAGLAEAYAGMALARTGNIGSEHAPAVFGGGLFWVEASDLGGGQVELSSTALYGSGRATLAMVCQPVRVGAWALGIFSAEDLVLGRAVTVDSYDGSRGPYALQVETPAGARAQVGSNGAVDLGPGSVVRGDVRYGAQARLETADAVLTGQASRRTRPVELPPIEVPTGLLPITLPRAESGRNVVPPGAHTLGTLAVARGEEVRLVGPLTLVVDDLSVDDGGLLTFDGAAGPVRLHVTRTLALESRSRVATTTTDPADTTLLVSVPEARRVELGSTGAFHGFVHAPEAAVHLAGTLEVFGGLVARRLVVGDGARIHMDLALASRLAEVRPGVQAWRVVEAPRLVRAGADPLRRLGLHRVDLQRPAAAHADQVLELSYLDRAGTARTYLGPESDFDWREVALAQVGTRDDVPFLIPFPRLPADPDVARAHDLVEALRSGHDPSDLRERVAAAAPLEPALLLAVIAAPVLESAALTEVLLTHSPLAPAVLEAALQRDPPLRLADLQRLLAAQ